MPATEDPSVNPAGSSKSDTGGQPETDGNSGMQRGNPQLRLALSNPWSIMGLAFTATVLVMLLPFAAPVLKAILAVLVALWWIMKQVARH